MRTVFTQGIYLFVFAGAVAHAHNFLYEEQTGKANDASKRTYEDVRAMLRDIVKANPANAELVTVTDSDSGRPVEGLKIGNGAVADVLVSTHHGNEYGATEVALAAAKDFAENPIAGRTVYVVPVLNISGYDKKTRNETKGNRNYDSNRDYEGACATEGPWVLKSTTGMAKFLADKNIVASATIHTFGPSVTYPWGVSTNDFSTLYNSAFVSLANSATSVSHYETGTSGEVVYPADGTFEDYSYWKYGVWSLLFEIGDTHSPDQQEVDELIRVNVPGLRKMYEDAQTTRAVDHRFTAQCSTNKGLDPHIE